MWGTGVNKRQAGRDPCIVSTAESVAVGGDCCIENTHETWRQELLRIHMAKRAKTDVVISVADVTHCVISLIGQTDLLLFLISQTDVDISLTGPTDVVISLFAKPMLRCIFLTDQTFPFKCVCMRACARARVCVCVCVCVTL